MHVFVTCVCGVVCARDKMRVSVYPYVFVSAPGSYEMGRHKQSIIITIKHVCDSLLWEKKRRDIN